MNVISYMSLYTVTQKTLHKLFLSELCQISINFNNFLVDDKRAEVLCHIYIFTSPYSSHHTTLLNTKVINFTVYQKNCEKFILSELLQLSTNFITFCRSMTK